MKKRIRLTESDLHRIVKESVKRILKESYGDYDNEIIGKLIQAGAKEMRMNGEYPDPEDLLDERGRMAVERGRGCVNWSIVFAGKFFCGRRTFNDEYKASEDCDRFIAIIGEENIDADNCTVEAIFDNGDGIETDTCMCYAGGGEWYD